jgi:N-acetyl sugar amidotransferase
MDNSSDPSITFDSNGICNYCTTALGNIGKVYFPDEEGEKRLNALLKRVKNEGKGKKYDCIMGLSGGLDSSYLAYLGHKWGLRVLAVHIDDGFDTDISKNNLKKLVDETGFDYEVVTPDEEQFNALTLAYLKAGVPNIAIPQDNVLFAFLYQKMKEYHIKFFFAGGNFALESILQRGNSYKASDVVNIKDINRRFGTTAIDKLRFISTIQTVWDKKILGLETPRALNYIDYNRDRAFAELKEFCGFEYYGRKHLENILTAFIQLYWFPKKFGVDKRTSHLSSMIVSGQMTREEALRELEEPLYDEQMMNEYIAIIKNKLGISDALFSEIMEAPTHMHEEFAVEDDGILYKVLRAIHHFGLK